MVMVGLLLPAPHSVTSVYGASALSNPGLISHVAVMAHRLTRYPGFFTEAIILLNGWHGLS